MDFNRKELEELRAIYREDFGGEITEDQAREIGTRLVNLVMLLRQKPQARSPEDGSGSQGA